MKPNKEPVVLHRPDLKVPSLATCPIQNASLYAYLLYAPYMPPVTPGFLVIAHNQIATLVPPISVIPRG